MTTDDKFAAFEGLLDEIRAALCDVVCAMQEKQDSASMDEIAASLIDLAEVFKGGLDVNSLAAAIKSLRITAPEVVVHHNVTVSPTPIQNNLPAPVVQFLERPQANVSLAFEYDQHDRIVKSTLTYADRANTTARAAK